ncbi:MAG: SgcJ/EcaC family oxidoreductase [Chloroflexi bacterium]|nr:SgcJ/EcaC family oxidoreductase [Chloroflexota bacterium]
MKLVDPVQGARLNDEVPPFATGHPNTLALDVSDRSPGDAAQEILDWVERCRGGDIEQWGAARIPAADADVGALYRQLTDYWNGRDAAAYGALFAEGGSIVGFDGSQVDGRDAIASHLAEIFANHPTPAYVVKVLEVRPLGPGAMLLRAAAGLLPPGASDLHPDLNSIQTLVATRHWGGWRVEMFQSTPAAFHGRPDLAERLTAELTEVLRGR